MGWTFAVLGPVRGWYGTEEIPLGSPQQRVVLAMLLLRGSAPLTLDQAIAGLWDSTVPRSANATVRTYLSRLRAVLNRDDATSLTSEHGLYTLRRPAGSVDAELVDPDLAAVHEATARGDLPGARTLIRRCAARWQGKPLAGLDGPFIEGQRARLTERHIAITEQSLRLDLELGAAAAAVATLVPLTAEHPLRESFRELLMLALCREGRTAEALDVFTDTRSLLREELGVDPGVRLSTLYRRILQQDPDLLGEPPQPAPASAPELPRPAQLPAASPVFVGRAEQLRALIDRLTPSDGAVAPPTCAITGVGGVGKTTLALQVAHALRGAYPDGQLYADLAGMSAEPADSRAVLAHFLHSLGVGDAAIPEDEPARAALYRSVLADRKVLVVLDNARDAQQVQPLLPGYPGCGVLITSRRDIATVADVPVPLDTLPPAQALDLLAALVEHRDVRAELRAAERLLRTVGHLPLAIRIVANQLSVHPASSVADLAARLADERDRLARLHSSDLDVRACFQLSYDRLSAAQQRAFRLLAWPDSPVVSVSCAAALLGMSDMDTERLLDQLVAAGLLQSATFGRYRYHDLVRLYASERLAAVDSPAAVAAAATRLTDFLLATLRRAYAIVRPGHLLGELLDYVPRDPGRGLDFANAAAACAWFAAERAFLIAVLGRLAVGNPDHVGDAARILLGMDPLLERTYGWQEIVVPSRRVADAARAAGDPRAEAAALYLYSGACWQVFDPAAAKESALRAMMLSRRVGDEVLLAEIWTVRAVILSGNQIPPPDADQLRGACAMYQTALELSERTGNVSAAANNLGCYGMVMMNLGDLRESWRYSTRSLELYRELGDGMGEAQVVSFLGRLYLTAGHTDEARVVLEAGLALCRRNNLPVLETVTLLRLTLVFMTTREWGDAERRAREADELSRRFGHPNHQAYAVLHLAQIERREPRPLSPRDTTADLPSLNSPAWNRVLHGVRAFRRPVGRCSARPHPASRRALGATE